METIQTFTMSNDRFAQLVASSEQLQATIATQSYVKYAAVKLAQLLADAKGHHVVLFAGREGVGKTTALNALLGRTLFQTDAQASTKVPLFLQYGEQEFVRVHFLDGITADFEMSQLDFIASAELTSAAIIREYVDYVEVRVRHPLVQQLVLVDTKPLELTAGQHLYMTEALLQRVHHVLWFIKAGEPLCAKEQAFCTQLQQSGIHVSFVVNQIDTVSSVRAAVDALNVDADIVPFSAKKAIEAKKRNDAQAFIDANMATMQQFIEQLPQKNDTLMPRIIARLIDWLALYYRELALVTAREPYITAMTALRQVQQEPTFAYSKQERDVAVMSSYEAEYRHVSTVLKDAETLYHVLQLLTKELYLRDEEVEQFEAQALYYHETIRNYRKLHSEYANELLSFEKLHQRTHQTNVEDGTYRAHKQNATLTQYVTRLNDLQQQLAELYVAIERFEQTIMTQLAPFTAHVEQLAKARLHTIERQLDELLAQRQSEQQMWSFHLKKLAEFETLATSQQFIVETLIPQLVACPLTPQQLAQVKELHEQYGQLTISQQALIEQFKAQFDLIAEDEVTPFASLYPLAPLSLKQANVLSDYPSVPPMLNIQYE